MWFGVGLGVFNAHIVSVKETVIDIARRMDDYAEMRRDNDPLHQTRVIVAHTYCCRGERREWRATDVLNDD